MISKRMAKKKAKRRLSGCCNDYIIQITKETSDGTICSLSKCVGCMQIPLMNAKQKRHFKRWALRTYYPHILNKIRQGIKVDLKKEITNQMKYILF